MVWIPYGTMTTQAIEDLNTALEREEALAQFHFDRFSDFSGIKQIDLSFDYVFKAALARRLAHAHGQKVKSAMIKGSLEVQHYSKLYAMVTERSALQVRFFATRAEAAAWLDCPVELLTITQPGQG